MQQKIINPEIGPKRFWIVFLAVAVGIPIVFSVFRYLRTTFGIFGSVMSAVAVVSTLGAIALMKNDDIRKAYERTQANYSVPIFFGIAVGVIASAIISI